MRTVGRWLVCGLHAAREAITTYWFVNIKTLNFFFFFFYKLLQFTKLQNCNRNNPRDMPAVRCPRLMDSLRNENGLGHKRRCRFIWHQYRQFKWSECLRHCLTMTVRSQPTCLKSIRPCWNNCRPSTLCSSFTIIVFAAVFFRRNKVE